MFAIKCISNENEWVIERGREYTSCCQRSFTLGFYMLLLCLTSEWVRDKMKLNNQVFTEHPILFSFPSLLSFTFVLVYVFECVTFLYECMKAKEERGREEKKCIKIDNDIENW